MTKLKTRRQQNVGIFYEGSLIVQLIVMLFIIIIIKHLLSAIHPGKNLLGGAQQDIQYIQISNYAEKLRTLLNN